MHRGLKYTIFKKADISYLTKTIHNHKRKYNITSRQTSTIPKNINLSLQTTESISVRYLKKQLFLLPVVFGNVLESFLQGINQFS